MMLGARIRLLDRLQGAVVRRLISVLLFAGCAHCSRHVLSV
jgi:hypothetical protein